MDTSFRKRMIRVLRRPVFVVLMLSLTASITLSLLFPERGTANLKALGSISMNLLLIIPAVVVIIGIIAVWIRPEAIEKHMGAGSGARGILAAVGLGLFSSLPVFMAFPMGNMLYSRGARLGNVFAFFGALAIPFPVLIIEAEFMGIRWMAVRLALTLPAVILVGLAGEWIYSRLRAGKPVPRLDYD